MTIECGVFAGIHTARKGGTTQMPSRVADCHHSDGSKYKLVLRMEMLRYYFPVLKIMGHTRNLRQHHAFPVHKDALALMRHELSQ